MERYDIIEPNLYGTDEVECSGTSGQRERVMGGAGRKGPQYQHVHDDRDNTTIIVTISADGTAPNPTVIFRGKAFHANWQQDNPANAS